MLKRDLRIQDHAALNEACKAGKVLCFYVYEPSLIHSKEWDASHGAFLNESLDSLEKDLQKIGIKLYRFVGEVVEVLNHLKRYVVIDTLHSHQETGNLLTFERDKSIKKWCKENGVKFRDYPQFGFIRGLKSRDGWASQWNKFMTLPTISIAPTVSSFTQNIPGEIKQFEFEPCSKPFRQKGGRAEARDTLESFLQIRGRYYSKEMSSPITAWEACSRLSPFFSFGVMSIREVWHSVLFQRSEGFSESGWKASLAAFSSRLRWHCHFMQKLEDEPSLEFQNMNRKMDGLRENNFNSDFFEAWKKGETGYPMVDACMRSLQQTGWINFRMRAMLVSFASYHLWLHWREPAQFLAKHFLDFEPGIHFSQFQMQSGTTGINAIRIYSPIKQVLDQDPNGEFIKKWVPELKAVPADFIAEPQKMPKTLQRQVGCVIGKNYPAPIVDHATAYQEAKKRIFSWRSQKEVREASKQVYLKHGSRKKRKENRSKTQKN